MRGLPDSGLRFMINFSTTLLRLFTNRSVDPSGQFVRGLPQIQFLWPYEEGLDPDEYCRVSLGVYRGVGKGD